MTVRERIPHTAKFLMAFHTAGGTRTAPATQEETTVEDPFTTAAAPAEDLRTQPQRDLMAKLLDELDGRDLELAAKARRYTEDMTEHGAWTPGREGNASAWITKLINKNKELRTAAQAARAAAPAEELEDGMYPLDGDVIKVVHAIHGSGRQYGKRLVAPEAPGENGSWERVPGIVAKLTPAHKLDLAKAMELGAVYGCCVRCAKGLTKESSIRQQMGDTCAGKF